MTYWFVQSQTHQCHPSLPQTDFRFDELMQKGEIFWQDTKSFILNRSRSVFTSGLMQGKCVQMDDHLFTACRWTNGAKSSCAFERYDLVKSVRYARHTSCPQTQTQHTNTRLNWHTDAAARTRRFIHNNIYIWAHTTIYSPTYSSSLPHPHISTRTS